MSQPTFDVVGIGNAIMDVIARCDEAFLQAEGIAKGGMTLIDAARAGDLGAKAQSAQKISGGAVANSIFGVVSLGGRGAFLGRVCKDQWGADYVQDMEAAGVHCAIRQSGTGLPTARCHIFVTPDGERSMNTFLGASTEFAPEDIDDTVLTDAKIVFLEGYLFDKPAAKNAFRTAATLAREAGRRVALTLSDAFCVERHRDEFRHLLESSVDIVFAEQKEIRALYPGADTETAARAAAQHVPLVVVTMSEQGSLALANGVITKIPAERVATVVDATGAGDLYAGGFLYGLTQNYDLATCGRIGSIAAAEAITHVGARPDTRLADLLREKKVA